MEKVIVKKTELLEKVKENRELHRKVFEEALIGYREKAIELLDQQVKRAKEGKKFSTSISLYQPQDQTKDYDRVITMLEMSINNTIELDQQQFAQYVMDDWHWSDQFWTSNAAYSGTAAISATEKGLM